MADVMTEDAIAQTHTCTRCAQESLLSVVGRCATCIADMGLRHPDEYQVWKADLNAEFGRR
ncbi:hypothetical protein [Pseudonocardia nigra]|uniref:hypothetical protein n=1 Tax=Pseudonocardia nigra TaxID=1921578 RepID=UPI001C5DE071|nr:hypothetical protein [Pseudonocardia nigra]